jgi:hypothetical protein
MLYKWRSVAAAAAFTTLLACQGTISDRDGDGSGGPAPVTPGPDQPTTPAAEKPRSFAVPQPFPVLLPFDVRMARLSAVVGLPLTDPAFELLNKNATQLGDYDFADGLEPDNTWTAFKISLWVRSLKPVCASPAMLARYPSLPESMGPLIEAAYGRAMTEQDTADVNAALAGLALAGESRTMTSCLAILSSLEFLAQ